MKELLGDVGTASVMMFAVIMVSGLAFGLLLLIGWGVVSLIAGRCLS